VRGRFQAATFGEALPSFLFSVPNAEKEKGDVFVLGRRSFAFTF